MQWLTRGGVAARASMFLFDESRNGLARAFDGASVRHGKVALCDCEGQSGRDDAEAHASPRCGACLDVLA
jgi:hypothetical protein